MDTIGIDSTSKEVLLHWASPWN